MSAGRRPVTIVILTWNGLTFTKRCLETLTRRTDFPEYRVLVVDNGSTDGTAEYLAERGGVEVLRNTANLGFARGNNSGIRAAHPSHDVVLLNNDTQVHQADWLARLQDCAYSATNIGVVGCRLRGLDGKLQHAGAYLPTDDLRGVQIGRGERDIGQYGDDREVEGVAFACVYLKRDVLDRVGLLDESYFCYYEDRDFCYRAARHGYRTICCGSVTLTHRENASTHSNPESRCAHIEASRKVFLSKWDRSLEEKRYTRDLGWQSTMSSPAGYAISSRELVSALDECGVFVSYRSPCGPGAATSRKEPTETQSERIRTIRARKLRPEQVQVLFGQGDLFQSNFGKYKIGFTMSETDRIPPEWVRQANQMDEVWTPSTFNLKTFQESGVTRPVYRIPLGVDPNYFNQRIRGHPIGGIYTFFSIFEWEEREAPELLLRAFNSEFRASEPAILLVKATNANPTVDVEREIANLGLDPQGGAIHFSLNQIVPAYELGVLHRSSNCFVLPTRGEGWGMPIMEAMACGLPVIATDWSAQRDFMNEENAFPLLVERLVPADTKRSDCQGLLWAEPSYAHLRRLMRYVYENQEEGRAKGERAASEIRDSWTWRHSAQAIIARLDKIQPRAFSGESWPRNLRDSSSFVR